MKKLILHLDLNNFYASVECKRNPSIAHLPVAVAGSPEKRHGVVLAKNQIAKGYGVKTGDTVSEAKAKAPGIVFVEPDFSEYDKLSKEMNKICQEVTSHVEPFGSDECWLDCTGSQRLLGSGQEIADLLREKIKSKLGLTASVGVSFTRIFAKMGSDMKKPDATTVIDEDNFRDKIWPLPVCEMSGVGRKTTEKLNKMNIYTLGQLASADNRVLDHYFGKVGLDLKRMARGEDDSDIREAVLERDVKSISHGLTALRDLVTLEDIRLLVYYLSELIAARLFKRGARAFGVAITLRSTELDYTTHQKALTYPVRSSAEIAETAMQLVKELWDRRPLRLISIAAYHLVSEHTPTQLSFFDEIKKSETNEKLDRAVAEIRKRFGDKIIIRAEQKNNDIYMDKGAGDFLPFKR